MTALVERSHMVPLPLRTLAASLFLNVAVLWAAQNAAPSAPPKIDIDLSKPFHTRSPWHFVALQEPSVFDSFIGEDVPGLILLCVRAGPTTPCDSMATPQPPAPIPASAWEWHYLNRADVVHSRGRASLLLLQTASEHSANGNQAIFTAVLAYDLSEDRFKQIYAHVTFRNENQEDRFFESGPLQGSMISAEPTSNAPFAYWITVHELESTLTYKQVLHYRSATRYADGNPLPVIDSEMPNIELRLGLWHPGLPLPVPASPAHPCPNPRLSHTALWCS